MDNKVEKIMKNYKKELDKIDKKYEVKQIKVPDTRDLEDKIKSEKELISKLEFEGKELNEEMIARAKERLELAMNEKAELDSKYQEELSKRDENVLRKNQLRNSKVVLESGREVTRAEKDKLDKADLKNKAIRELTSESKAISEALLTKKAELESKRKEWNEFKYEYEKDENGKLKPQPINADEVKKIRAEFDNIKNEMIELDKMQKQCDEYLAELKAPTKDDKDFMKTWSDTAKEQTQPVQGQPTQTQPTQTQPTQTQPTQSQPTQSQPTQTQPTQQQPVQIQSVQGQPTQAQQVKSITINANTGKATVVTEQGEKEIEIEDLIENRKGLYESVHLDRILEDKGKTSAIAKALFKRKVNPIILKAIESDDKMIEGYIDSLIDNSKELPFEYVHNLEDSSLSNKNTRFMNRIGLKEEKIRGAEVNGAEKFFGIKKFFRYINKNRTLNAPKQPQQLPSGKQKKLRDDPTINMGRDPKEIFNGLTAEQQDEIKGLLINNGTSDLQVKYGLTYNEAHGLLREYGKKPSQDKLEQNQSQKDQEKDKDDNGTITL